MTRVVVQRGPGPSSSQSRPPSASASAPPSAPGSSSSTPPLNQQLSTLPLHTPSPSTISPAPTASSLSADESSEISAKEAIHCEPQSLVTDSSGKSLPLCSLLDGRGAHFEVDLDDRVPGVGSTEADGNKDTAERKKEPYLASQLQNVLALEKPREVAEGYGPSCRAEDDAGMVVDVVADGEAQVEVPETKLGQSSADLIRQVSTDLLGCRKQEDGGVSTVPSPEGHQHPVQNMIQLPPPPSVPSTFIPLSVPAPYPHTHVQPVSFGPSLPPLPSHPSPASVNDTGLLSRTYEETDPARSTAANVLDAVGCSYLAAPSPPAPSAPFTSGSSRRGGWVGPSASSTTRGGITSRRIPRSVKGSRSSPNSSKPTSPRSYGEGDGYNSADEQNPWAPGPSGYEDSMERERQFEIELRRSKGLEVRRMSEDGNCLFRAVADRVYGDPDMYDETREMCIDYMEKERDHFSQFVTESFTAYCKRKRRDKVYGNNLEIQAMAEMYNRPIHIYCYSIEPINIFHGSYETDLPPIRLSYHRGNHYNSLVDPRNPAVGAGLGFGSLRGRNVDTEQVKAALKAQQDQQIDKALLAEGSFYSDMELTEQEIERMVMEASRAEFLAGQSFRIHFPWHEETSTSAGAEPSSSGTTGSPKNTNDVLEVAQTADRQPSARPVNLPATSTGTADNVLPNNVRILLSMGFSYLRVMEALSIFGDNVNNMLCYLLETESHGAGDGETGKRRKGKVAE